MRWLAVWLVLAGVFFAGQLVVSLSSGVSGGTWEYAREDLAHLATIPLVQLAAIWIVVLVRRHSRSPHLPGPPLPSPPSPPHQERREKEGGKEL